MKVILINNNGKEAEYENFILYAFTKEGSLANESIANIRESQLAYVEKRLDVWIRMRFAEETRELQLLKELDEKYQK